MFDFIVLLPFQIDLMLRCGNLVGNQDFLRYIGFERYQLYDWIIICQSTETLTFSIGFNQGANMALNYLCYNMCYSFYFSFQPI